MTPGYTHTFLGFLLPPHCRERSAFLIGGICSHLSRGSPWAVPRPRDAPGSLPPSPNTSYALTTSGREGHCLHHIPAADLGCFQLLYRFRVQTGLVLILTVLEANSFREPEAPKAESNPVPSLSSMGFEEGTIPQPEMRRSLDSTMDRGTGLPGCGAGICAEAWILLEAAPRTGTLCSQIRETCPQEPGEKRRCLLRDP